MGKRARSAVAVRSFNSGEASASMVLALGAEVSRAALKVFAPHRFFATCWQAKCACHVSLCVQLGPHAFLTNLLLGCTVSALSSAQARFWDVRALMHAFAC